MTEYIQPKGQLATAHSCFRTGTYTSLVGFRVDAADDNPSGVDKRYDAVKSPAEIYVLNVKYCEIVLTL